METLAPSKTETFKGKITFAAFHPRTQLPVTCRPGMDKSGKIYTGQGKSGYWESLTKDEKDKIDFLVTPTTSYTLEDGKVLDLENPYDAVTWKWLQRHPYLTLERSKRNKDNVFFVVNPQKEAQMYLDTTAKVDEARPAVRKLSSADQARVASALGLHAAETFPPEQLLQWMLQKANTDPQAVLDAINPENRGKVNAKNFLTKAVMFGVIERLKDGLFYFGGEKGINIGHSEDMVIDYLLNPENKDRVRGMQSMLMEKTKTKPAETDFEEKEVKVSKTETEIVI